MAIASDEAFMRRRIKFTVRCNKFGKAARRYRKYRKATTVGRAIALGASRKDLRWDWVKGLMAFLDQCDFPGRPLACSKSSNYRRRIRAPAVADVPASRRKRRLRQKSSISGSQEVTLPIGETATPPINPNWPSTTVAESSLATSVEPPTSTTEQASPRALAYCGRCLDLSPIMRSMNPRVHDVTASTCISDGEVESHDLVGDFIRQYISDTRVYMIVDAWLGKSQRGLLEVIATFSAYIGAISKLSIGPAAIKALDLRIACLSEAAFFHGHDALGHALGTQCSNDLEFRRARAFILMAVGNSSVFANIGGLASPHPGS